MKHTTPGGSIPTHILPLAAHVFSRFAPRAFLLPCLLLPLLLSACSSGGASSPARVPATALVTEGPSLALVGEYAGMKLEGYMDRSCMTGYGTLGLRAVGQYRRGDVSVAVPNMPDVPTGSATAAGPAKNAKPSPLTLASYPAKRSQKTGEAGAQVKPSPTSTSATAKKKNSGGLVLASYPQDTPPPPAKKLLPEEMGNELLPDSPLLRTQGANAAEYESSVPVAIEFVCEAKVDAPPTDKARIRGVMECSGGRNILFSLRNIGPDQGVGVGKETQDSSLMILFYHASMEEARRRFPSVREDIRLAQQGQQ